eukprot:272379-Chlamydomonas_euryale.AAC.4
MRTDHHANDCTCSISPLFPSFSLPLFPPPFYLSTRLADLWRCKAWHTLPGKPGYAAPVPPASGLPPSPLATRRRSRPAMRTCMCAPRRACAGRAHSAPRGSALAAGGRATVGQRHSGRGGARPGVRSGVHAWARSLVPALTPGAQPSRVYCFLYLTQTHALACLRRPSCLVHNPPLPAFTFSTIAAIPKSTFTLCLDGLSHGVACAAAVTRCGDGVNRDSRGCGLCACALQGGVTALHCAAHAGRADSVSLLLAAGARGEVTDAGGATPLHCAACAGSDAAAALLLAAGLEAGRPDARARTPLHAAAQCGKRGVCALLLARGGCVHALDAVRASRPPGGPTGPGPGTCRGEGGRGGVLGWYVGFQPYHGVQDEGFCVFAAEVIQGAGFAG